MDVTMLLCDHAQVAEGKLYVLGGGWNQVPEPDVPIPVALAVQIAVPWDATNQKHDLTIRLADDDGQTIEAEGEGTSVPILMAGQFEVGRPPGIKQGTPINQLMVFKFGMLPLPAGGYTFELAIKEEVLARTPFRVGQA
jgi:hypothetical protein